MAARSRCFRQLLVANMEHEVAVIAEQIDVGSRTTLFLARLAAAGYGGAVASFTGTVRDTGQRGQPISKLQLEHYPGMAERQLTFFAATAAQQWQLHGIAVVHRYGDLYPSEVIVHVQVAAERRQPAQEACAYIVERLKYEAPFWKKECSQDSDSWVELRSADAEV